MVDLARGDRAGGVVDSFPIDLKTRLEVESLWQREIEKRIEDVKSGRVELMGGQAVFGRIRVRLQK